MRKILVAISLVSTVMVAPAVGRASVDEPCGARLLVLSAFPGEIDLLLASATIDAIVEADTFTFYEGALRGNDVVLGLTGIGLVNAEAAARAAFERYGCVIGGVVFSGVSGGRTSIGDVTIPARWTEDEDTWFEVDEDMLAVAHDVAESGTVALARAVPTGDPACVGIDPRLVPTVSLAHEPAIIHGGMGKSTDPFGGRALPCFPGGGDVFGCRPCRAPLGGPPDVERVATGIAPFLDPSFISGYFANPPTTSGYDADDMETAAIARVAAERGIPFIAFRALSDGQGDPLMLPGFPFQFFVYRQLAADNAARVALEFLDAWAARAPA